MVSLGVVALSTFGSGQIIVPSSLTSRVLQMLYDDLGHFGTAKVSSRVKERFFWSHVSGHRGMVPELLAMPGGKTQFWQEELHCKQSSVVTLGNW